MTKTSVTSKSTLRRRLRGVALTYHRPAVWLLLSIALLAWGVAFAQRFNTRVNHPIAPEGRPSVEWARLTRQSTRRTSVERDGINWPDLRALQVIGAEPSTLPQQLRQSTELEALALIQAGWGGRGIPANMRQQAERLDPWERTGLTIAANQLQPEELDVLATEELNYLELEQCSLAPETLRNIGLRFPIKTLVIDEFTLLGQYQELESFQSLEFLEVRGAILSGDLIGTLLALPSLRTLVLDTDEDRGRPYRDIMHSGVRPFPKAMPPTTADLARLREHPTLTWVYADWKYQGLTDAEARELLRPVRGMSVWGNDRLQLFIFAAEFGFLFFVVMLVIQLGMHFATPTPLIMPHAPSAHFAWAALALAAGLAAAVGAIVQEELRPLPLAAVFLALPAVLSAVYAAASRMTPRQQKLVGYLGFVFPLAMILPQWIWRYFESSCRWFLLGEQPGWALGLIAAESLLIGLGCRQLRSAYRQSSERGTTHPLVLDAREQQAWAQYPERWSPPRATGVWAWHQGRSSRRADLWRRSLPMIPWKTALPMTLYMLLVLGLTQLWLRSRGSSSTELLQALPAFTLGMFAFFSTIFAVTAWALRRLLLADELLRPIRREDFVRDVFRACATSLWPAALVPLAAGMFALQKGLPAVQAGCAVVWVAGVLLFTGAWAMWSFAVRATMLNRILTSLPLFFCPVVLSLSVVIPTQLSTPDAITVTAWLGIAGAALTGGSVLVIAAAYRRAVAREWGGG